LFAEGRSTGTVLSFSLCNSLMSSILEHARRCVSCMGGGGGKCKSVINSEKRFESVKSEGKVMGRKS
jgi:hypothetical protein